LQGAFGERIEADLVTLKVRLHQECEGVETPYIPIVFALTDALMLMCFLSYAYGK